MTTPEWVLSDDTGISSKTIWAVMMGAVPKTIGPFWFDVPHDPSDFGRCYRLLVRFPDWRPRLMEVAARFPKWGPMVREWERMEALNVRDMESGKSEELFAVMRTLEDEGRIADGWVKTSPCGRKRNERRE